MGFPDFDQAVDSSDESLTVIDAIEACYQEADEAKWDRLSKNQENRDAFLCRQDWSHKLPGQSTEFLPKVPIAVEQMAAVVKRGLMAAGGDFFSFDVSPVLANKIGGPQLVKMLMTFLENLWAPNGQTTDIYTVLGDAVKNGMLESLMILKVHGGMVTTRDFRYERGVELDQGTGKVSRKNELQVNEYEDWKLRIDLVRPEDYFPDPTGNGLYEIHEVERDLHDVQAMVDDGIYDKKAVDQLVNEDYPRELDQKRSDQARNQPIATNPKFRKRVVLREFWGSLLAPDGTLAHRNVVATVANNRFLIRPPEPNPFWHQESPFVVAPLIRVPWSVWHKALFDNASSLNLAINEMFNLILDGGMSSVWGVRQIRMDDLEDPGQVEGGIQQGATLAVKSTLPHNAKVLEQITEGDIPGEAFNVFQFLNSEFAQAAMTNELKLGQLPQKQVRATEVVEANQSQGVTLDSLIGDLEKNLIGRLLMKSLWVVLQNADRIPQETVVDMLNMVSAQLIMRAPPEERFALFYGKARVKVSGLTATINKNQEFQRLMAAMQVIMSNPALMQAFMAKFSADKALNKIFTSLNVDPMDIQMDATEMQQAPQRMQQTLKLAQSMGLTKGIMGGSEGRTTGAPGLQSEISQMGGPATGLSPSQ